nr:MAG TPA: hypothetical protein [Caudoviricetes sp.]
MTFAQKRAKVSCAADGEIPPCRRSFFVFGTVKRYDFWA